MAEHYSRLTLVGWATPAKGGCVIHGLTVRLFRALEAPARVVIHAQPYTAPDGGLNFLLARKATPATAGQPNSALLGVTGQLLKLDRSEGLIKLKVSPSSAKTLPYLVSLRASDAVLLTAQPDTPQVSVRGQLLTVRGVTVLLANAIHPVHAPVPAHWHRWRAGRVGRAPIPTS